MVQQKHNQRGSRGLVNERGKKNNNQKNRQTEKDAPNNNSDEN